MHEEKEYSYQGLENSSHQTDTMPTGSDQFWLEAPEKLRGIASFQTDLSEINIQSSFEATPQLKKSPEKITHVRRKHSSRESLF